AAHGVADGAAGSAESPPEPPLPSDMGEPLPAHDSRDRTTTAIKNGRLGGSRPSIQCSNHGTGYRTDAPGEIRTPDALLRTEALYLPRFGPNRRRDALRAAGVGGRESVVDPC